MQVGYIGLGAMGGALARHLVGKFEVTVLDVNSAAMAEFERLGATSAPSAAELARRCDVILLCLPRSSDVRKVIFGPGGLVEGLSGGEIIIDQTSGAPAETREFAERLAQQGVALMDAPVSGAMAAAIAGKVSIIASGPPTTYETALPVLQAMSPNVFHCGDRIGNGQTIKAVNNMMNASCRLATLEIVAMGRKLGLPLELMTSAINSTTARNFTSRGMLHAIAEGRQSTKFALALQVKDANQAIGLGTDCGVPMPLSNTVRGLLQIGLNTLGVNPQLEDMIRLIESMAGVRLAPQHPAT